MSLLDSLIVNSARRDPSSIESKQPEEGTTANEILESLKEDIDLETHIMLCARYLSVLLDLLVDKVIISLEFYLRNLAFVSSLAKIQARDRDIRQFVISSFIEAMNNSESLKKQFRYLLKSKTIKSIDIGSIQSSINMYDSIGRFEKYYQNKSGVVIILGNGSNLIATSIMGGNMDVFENKLILPLRYSLHKNADAELRLPKELRKYLQAAILNSEIVIVLDDNSTDGFTLLSMKTQIKKLFRGTKVVRPIFCESFEPGYMSKYLIKRENKQQWEEFFPGSEEIDLIEEERY